MPYLESKSGRMCSNCHRTKTVITMIGKSQWEQWHGDGNGGHYCSRCYDTLVVGKHGSHIKLNRRCLLKLTLLKAHNETTKEQTIERVVDYYISNRLDKQARKELLKRLK